MRGVRRGGDWVWGKEGRNKKERENNEWVMEAMAKVTGRGREKGYEKEEQKD